MDGASCNELQALVGQRSLRPPGFLRAIFSHGRCSWLIVLQKPVEVTETTGRTGTIGNLREFTLRDGGCAATAWSR
jgi:hypothetical protein